MSTRIAELSGEAMALIDLIAASGSLLASAGVFWPGICKPEAISQTASFQFWSRQSWAIRPGHHRARARRPRGR